MRSSARGAVRLVHETGKPIAQIARDLGINEGTLGNWVARDQASRNGIELSRDDLAELKRLRSENAELLKRFRGPVGEGGDEVSVARRPEDLLPRACRGVLRNSRPVRGLVLQVDQEPDYRPAASPT